MRQLAGLLPNSTTGHPCTQPSRPRTQGERLRPAAPTPLTSRMTSACTPGSVKLSTAAAPTCSRMHALLSINSSSRAASASTGLRCSRSSSGGSNVSSSRSGSKGGMELTHPRQLNPSMRLQGSNRLAHPAPCPQAHHKKKPKRL